MNQCLHNSTIGNSNYQKIVDRIGKLYNMPHIEVRVSNYGNACATIRRGLFNNKMYIVYNWQFIQDIEGMGSCAIMTVFAHEIGHLYHRHLGSTPERELQADRFAGRTLNRLNGTHSHGVHLYDHPLFIESATHPCRDLRKNYFTKGWNDAASGIPFECYKKEEADPMQQLAGTLVVSLLLFGLIGLLAKS